ncbi:hypothetical protein N9051_01855 [Akkermansiaceae bacterium]|nr:hypothetical protein [Akkermansiaceae bacterium]
MSISIITSDGGDGEVEVWTVEGELVMVLWSDLKMAADVLGDGGSGSGSEAEDSFDFELLGESLTDLDWCFAKNCVKK